MNQKLPFLAAAVSLAFALAAPAAFAGTGNAKDSNASTTTTTTRTMSDAHFAKEAAEGGIAEVKLGQLAEERGDSPQVKDFGKRMVDDHSKANERLKTAASTDKIALPEQMDAKDQATYDRLSKLSGTAFDRAYARDMVRDHETDVAAFRHEANYGKDSSIKGFASQTLPTLQGHLKSAREVYNGVSANNHNSTTGEKTKTGA